MQERAAKTGKTPVTPIEPITIPDDVDYPHLTPEEADQLFIEAVVEIPTQPLPRYTPREQQRAERRVLILIYVSVASLVLGCLVGIVTLPTVTVTLIPVQKEVSVTTSLTIAVRQLAPVTLSAASTAPTTGRGHTDAGTATGILTLYNGLFTPQTIPAGTVFSGADGMQVATEQSVTLPAGNPPTYGEASVPARALHAGSQGNLHAGAIHTTLANGVLVTNSAFRGGRDARDFQAVAERDLATLTWKLKRQLAQQFPQAFPLRPGEAVQPTNCMFSASADHAVGDEASILTVKATDTCTGIAYNQDELQRQARAAFVHRTAPGRAYQLFGEVRVQLARVNPLTVSCSGRWVYTLTQDDQEVLAAHIAGDTPAQAEAYLLKTEGITRALVTRTLPQDPLHIKFVILIGV